MWSYSTATVYDMYRAAIADKKRDTHALAQLLRVTGITARETNKKGNESIFKTWDGLLKALEPDKMLKKAARSVLPSKRSDLKMPEAVAKNNTAGAQQAANVANEFLAAGNFIPLKFS